MNVDKGYVLDTNIFIGAFQQYYPFDFCPGFWDCLSQQHNANRVFSIDKVAIELAGIRDQLSDWAKQKANATLFQETTDLSVVQVYKEIANWVNSNKQFTPSAKTDFMGVADGWVIAYAKANNLKVVTLEEIAPESKRRVPMPNLCLQFNVNHCNTFEMLRELKIQLVISPQQSN
jgi:Domain of unknown function (DUF4411)